MDKPQEELDFAYVLKRFPLAEVLTRRRHLPDEGVLYKVMSGPAELKSSRCLSGTWMTSRTGALAEARRRLARQKSEVDRER